MKIIKRLKKKKKKKKKTCERYQSLSKEEKEKKNNMVINNIKIYQKTKNKSLMSIEKNIKWQKSLIIIRNFLFFKKVMI